MDTATANWQQEGAARFQQGTAFFRSQARPARDLGVLAAAIERQRLGSLNLLETMAGCGVRSLRYALEANVDRLVVSDADPELQPLLQQNLAAIMGDRLDLRCDSARRLFAEAFAQQRFFDFVDVDAFGTASEHLASAWDAVKVGGCLYFTATDGRSLSGHDRDLAFRAYGVWARSHPSIPEQGLRLLIAALQHQAWQRGFGIQPLFSYYSGQAFRVLIRLLPTSSKVNQQGWLGYCHHCGQYQVRPWRQLSPAALQCPEDGQPLALTGPLWIGPLHEVAYLQALQQQAIAWNWTAIADLLQQFQAEATLPPYCYTLGEIGRRGRQDPPARSRLIQALQTAGFAAAASHCQPQAFKTSAPWQACLKLARSLVIDDANSSESAC
ncbi:SAM-dependent methyltransferase [Synechococcus elongatus]|uniref:SAM-dependent methyltransferase n=1 Tax=Synechococcus elongatus PCC 11802 TaxID=2283154 RepID=A0AAT9K3R4_SYNEL|nr:SAM-dependent methyltransferase [Synechococcus elongatus]QFZ91580.1 SAM-dependent methyltransferase [Synechococcus elongatus PCC 11802]